jgi:site-specific recombinase XerD
MLQKKHAANDFVFHKSDGARWTDNYDSFQTLVRQCGLEAEPPFNSTLHTLRHTIGSWAAISGASMRAIQKLMELNSVVTTERYAHLSAHSLAAVARNVGAFVTNPATALPKGDQKALPEKPSSVVE